MSTKKKSEPKNEKSQGIKAQTDTQYCADLVGKLSQAVVAGDDKRASEIIETVNGYVGSLLQRQQDTEKKAEELQKEALRLQALRQSLQDAATAVRDIRNCKAEG